jgi:hypothetical protein
MSIKIFNDTIRDRTRDLPVCSAVQKGSNSGGELEVGGLIVIAKYY